MTAWRVGRVAFSPCYVGPPPQYNPNKDVFKLGPSPKPLYVFVDQSKQATNDFPCGWDERDALV